MSVIITGARGQLGRALQERFPEATATSHEELDIANPRSLESFDWSKFSVVINAAAYTEVDQAETERGRVKSWQVNAEGVAHLARHTLRHNLTLVHVSTDYVFDGTREIHDEEEPFSPLSVYGASKAAGDIAVALNPNHYTLRTSWVIGEGRNFVQTIMSLASRNISPTVVSDQIGRLTFAPDLAAAIDHLLVTRARPGTYNVSGSGKSVSWADVTREIFSLLDRQHDLTVTNTSTADYFAGKVNIAPRPLHSTLNLGKIESTGFAPEDWQVGLSNYVRGV